MNRRFLAVFTCGLLLTACGAPDAATGPAVKLSVLAPGNTDPPGRVHLRADVTSGRSVRSVTFTQGTRSLGTDTDAPFEATDTLKANGTYPYRAVATDDQGVSAEARLEVTIQFPTGLQSLNGLLMESGGLNGGTLVLNPWSGGAGALTVTLSGTEVTRAAVQVGGTFTLTLPSAVDATLLPAVTADTFGASGCAAAPHLSSADARGALAGLRVLTGSSTPVAPATASATLVNGVPRAWVSATGLLVFVDRPLNVTGTVTCALGGGAGPATFDLALVPGWNQVSSALAVNSAGSSLSVTGGSWPSGTWVSPAPVPVP